MEVSKFSKTQSEWSLRSSQFVLSVKGNTPSDEKEIVYVVELLRLAALGSVR